MPATSSILPLGHSRKIYDRAYPTNARTEILSLISSSLSHSEFPLSLPRVSPVILTIPLRMYQPRKKIVRSKSLFLHSLDRCTLTHL